MGSRGSYGDGSEEAALRSSTQEYLSASGTHGGSGGESFDENMFRLEKLETNFNSYGLIKLAIARNNTVLIATQTNQLIQFNAHNEEIMEIELPMRADSEITGLFADEGGKHYLISLAENGGSTHSVYYLQPSYKKPKLLSKLKGLKVSAVGWDQANRSDSTTRAILLGTADGHLYETQITKGREDYNSQLYSIKDSMVTCTEICGLEVQRISERVFYIMAATASRFYEFQGGPNFEALFGTLGSNPPFTELPGDPDMHSELHVFTAPRRRHKQFAWLTGAGIYNGQLTTSSKSKKKADVVSDKELLQYPPPSDEEGGAAAGLPKAPISIGVSEFHFFLLHSDKLQVVNTLNQQVVCTEPFKMKRMKGEPQGLLYDVKAGQHWLYTDRFLFKIVIEEEDRHMWSLYLDKGQYEEALMFCHDATQKDQVLTRQASRCFEQKDYDMAAAFYAKTRMSFEEITLKFVDQKEPDALKTFLVNKLENIMGEDATQLTLICSWLVEIYMHNLNTAQAAEDAAGQHGAQPRGSGTASSASIAKDFKMFLADNEKHLDRTTTYNLLSSHGRMEELLEFAMILQDYERVITQYTQTLQWKKALEMLQKHQSSELYYKFSPVLMVHVPYLTVNAWIAAMGCKGPEGEPIIEPRKLIPALMRYDPMLTGFADEDEVPPDEQGSNQAVRFLLHCIDYDMADPAICNYLVSVLAQQPNEKPLMRFLNNKRVAGAGAGAGGRCYDVKYALRQCMTAGKQEAVVYLYGELGLYEEAVERALALGDLKLAIANAERPAIATESAHGEEETTELRKLLWLRIARHVVEARQDIQLAIKLMIKSKGLIKIEDILPFFPGFARIDDFKDEICQALDKYNTHIDELKREMSEATSSSERIRRDMRDLGDRYAFVRPTDCCLECEMPVLSRKFCVFSCFVGGTQCMYHADCLATKVRELSPPAVKTRVDQLNTGIEAHEASGDSASAAALRLELSEIIASDCPRCGSILADTVDRPFGAPSDGHDVDDF